MAVAAKNKKALSGGLKRRGQVPTKRYINLAMPKNKPIKLGLAIPAVVLILVAAGLFSKFLVIDRLAEVAAAQRQVAELQNRLDAGYEELADYDDLSILYAHYTFSGMTAEELQRTDRVEVLSLIERIILPQAGVTSWSLTGNELTVNMTGSTLQEINLIVQQLEADELVNFCTVTTAATNESRQTYNRVTDTEVVDEYTVVTARVVAYLNAEGEVDQR